jgi:hypothetical protein
MSSDVSFAAATFLALFSKSAPGGNERSNLSQIAKLMAKAN